MRWASAALGPDGRLYCAPACAPRVLRVDPGRTVSPAAEGAAATAATASGGDRTQTSSGEAAALAARPRSDDGGDDAARTRRRGGWAEPMGDDLAPYGDPENTRGWKAT